MVGEVNRNNHPVCTSKLPMTFSIKPLLSLAAYAIFIFGTCLTAQAEDHSLKLPGLSIGQSIPEFSLKNASGEAVSSNSLLVEDRTLAVIFFRSAGWCPYCKKHLSALNAGLEGLEAAGVNLVGISYDSVDTLSSFSKKADIQFPLLADRGSKVIDGFKVRNEGVTKSKAAGVPHPVLFLVNSEGIITGKLGYEGYKQRPPAGEIIAAVHRE